MPSGENENGPTKVTISVPKMYQKYVQGGGMEVYIDGVRQERTQLHLVILEVSLGATWSLIEERIILLKIVNYIY